MMYLLDTDTFSLAHHGRPALTARIDAARRAGNEVVLPVVTRIEVLRGRFDAVLTAADGAALLRAVELLRSSEAYLAEFQIVPFDTTAAAVFDRLRGDKRVRKVGRNDFLSACISLAYDATLVTRNLKDFSLVPGLKVENWAD